MIRNSGANTAQPIERTSGAGSDLQDVYHRLHQDILSGAIAPGEILNQVHIAKFYGISRTPVREALRMLQAEGLVEAQFQHRMRVADVSPEEIDAVYATWIVMQSLGVALTVPKVNAAELALIRDALGEMKESMPMRSGSQSAWEHSHVLFHRRLVMHAGLIITNSIDNCWSRSERARRAYMRSAPQSWLDSEAEHNAIVEAYEEGSIGRAIYATSQQLARIALIVIGAIDPGYEPRAIRQALNLISRPNGEAFETATGRLGKSAPAHEQRQARQKKSAASALPAAPSLD